MPTDRLSLVLAAMAAADGDGSASMIDRLCGAAVDLLSLKGAGLSLMVAGELQGTAGVSDPGIAGAGVRAVFAFPLHLGAIRLGVLVLYGDRPGALSAEMMAVGLVLADVATQVVLGLQAGAPADGLHEVLASEPAHWAEIHQATGMVSLQLGVSLDEAFVRLRAHAFGGERPLRAVAHDVVGRRLRLEEPA